MSEVLRSYKNTPKKAEADENVSKTRNNKVNFSSEFIRVNKNEINYSQLSNEIKHIFVFSLKKCYDLQIMKEVFHRWQDDNHTPTHPQKIVLTNEDATQLIWRMQKMILNNKMTGNLNILQKEVQELQKQRLSYLNSYKEMEQKQKQITSIESTSQQSQKSINLVQKIANYKNWLSQKLQLINQQIEDKKQKIKQIEKELKFSKESTIRISNHLTKIIIKEVRSLLKQTIIGILQISNHIIKSSQIDEQEVYVIFEQSYKTIRIKKTTIVMYLGSDFYLQKVNYFRALLKARIEINEIELKNKNIVCCHRCMKVCKLQKLNFCNIQIGQFQLKPYPSTDYLNYRRNYLQGDFFYDPKEPHVIPFYQYNKNSRNKLTCNRAFCDQCVKHFYVDKPFACPYCLGVCACPRCEKAVAIVKLMALDYENDPEGTKPYHELLKLFGGKPHKNISQYLKVRQSSLLQEFHLFKDIFEEFNQKYSIIRPNINPSNRKQINFKKRNKKNQQNKQEFDLFYQGKQPNQPCSKEKAPIKISEMSKKQDDYLNQLLEPLFYKNLCPSKSIFENFTETI